MSKHPVYGYLTKQEFEEAIASKGTGLSQHYKELAAKRQAAEYLSRKNRKTRK